MATLALSELIGTRVYDSLGAASGRVREVALYFREDPSHVSSLVVKTRGGDRLIEIKNIEGLSPQEVRSVSAAGSAESWPRMTSSEGLFFLERDLLDQQIIDVHGRKVVRVNDVELLLVEQNGTLALRIAEVEIGPRGAVRRLLKGIVPRTAVESLVARLAPKVIPWEFVNLIETDPARRVHLKIEHSRLSEMHPADLADILEDLAPAQREAVFETLDEDVAAEALEEIDPKMQRSLFESMASERAADIVEEMDPNAAADLLESLPEERSDEILKEMEPEEREEVTGFLEVEENTAADWMTTAYLAAAVTATVGEAIDLIRNFDGGVEVVSTIYLVDSQEKLVGAVPLAVLAISQLDQKLAGLSVERLISCETDANDKSVAELFDKYNLLTLPVVNAQGRLEGVITADDVISMLREKV